VNAVCYYTTLWHLKKVAQMKYPGFLSEKVIFMTLCMSVQPMSLYNCWGCFSGSDLPIYHTAWSLCPRTFTSSDHWGNTLKGNISVIMIRWKLRCTVCVNAEVWLPFFAKFNKWCITGTDLNHSGSYTDGRRCTRSTLGSRPDQDTSRVSLWTRSLGLWSSSYIDINWGVMLI
jgi:hypothetical protein